MEECEKELPCLEKADSAEPSRRTRMMKKSAELSALQSDEDDLFSSSGDSDDEWNVSYVSRKQKGRRNRKTVPKQTLKSKLLEKTRKLRQLSKSTSAPAAAEAPTDECIPNEENVLSIASTEYGEKKRLASPVKMKSELTSNEINVTLAEDTKPSFDKMAEKIKCESPALNIKLKNETKQTNDDVIRRSAKNKDKHDRKPIVIEYSTNHFHVSGMKTSPANLSQPMLFPYQMDPSIISSQVVSAKSTISEKYGDGSVCLNKGTSQSVNLNNQSGKNVASSQFPITTANRRKVSTKRQTSGARVQQKPAGDPHKVSPITRFNDIKIVKNRKINTASVTRPGKMTMPSIGGYANRVLNKFRDISPNGTVIHTGTGSVTITPRKIVNEKPPKQRKLFKNEIEGTISGRSIGGILRYVVNLANGTFIPLSDLQVEKLREQHQGALPIKLKIPVPSDVAEKIEPSFLIED